MYRRSLHRIYVSFIILVDRSFAARPDLGASYLIDTAQRGSSCRMAPQLRLPQLCWLLSSGRAVICGGAVYTNYTLMLGVSIVDQSEV